MDNPYSPTGKPSHPPANSPGSKSVQEPERVLSRLSTSQNAIVTVSLVLGSVAVLSAFGFVYNLFQFYPGTETYTILENPYWMFMHVVRVVCFGGIAWQLWSYQLAINALEDTECESRNEFVFAHNRLWKLAGIMMVVMAFFLL